MIRASYIFFVEMLVVTAAGCAIPPHIMASPETAAPAQGDQLRRRALACLTAAIRYERNPAVRVQGVEAVRSCECAEGLPWIRSALLDEQPAVRFAGCVAIGELRDAVGAAAVRERLEDENASVRVAALFAMHRLGRREQSSRIPTYALEHPDASVRRNAVMLLGLLGEPGAVKVLARAMKDGDPGVRDQALEAMARLGNPEAKQELTFLTESGVGADEVFALQALSSTHDPRYVPTLRHKFDTAAHLECRLAAARGLALFGQDVGFDLAMKALRSTKTVVVDPQDSAEGQLLRVRQLAAATLGALGRPQALPALAHVLDDSDDPRLQVSAAQAILEILAPRQRAPAFPAAPSKSG